MLAIEPRRTCKPSVFPIRTRSSAARPHGRGDHGTAAYSRLVAHGAATNRSSFWRRPLTFFSPAPAATAAQRTHRRLDAHGLRHPRAGTAAAALVEAAHHIFLRRQHQRGARLATRCPRAHNLIAERMMIAKHHATDDLLPALQQQVIEKRSGCAMPASAITGAVRATRGARPYGSIRRGRGRTRHAKPCRCPTRRQRARVGQRRRQSQQRIRAPHRSTGSRKRPAGAPFAPRRLPDRAQTPPADRPRASA